MAPNLLIVENLLAQKWAETTPFIKVERVGLRGENYKNIYINYLKMLFKLKVEFFFKNKQRNGWEKVFH